MSLTDPPRSPGGGLLAIALTSLLACSAAPAGPPPPVPPPPGDHVVFGFGLYHLPRPKGDPDVVFRTLLNHQFTELQLGPKTPGALDLSFASIKRVDLVGSMAPTLEDLAPPFGNGLTAEQKTAATHSQVASLLKFEISRQHLWRDLRSAYRLTSALARSTGGVLLDLDTNRYCSVETWEGTRLAAFVAEVPDVQKLIEIRLSKGANGERAVTRGMEKLDLPDLVVEAFPPSLKNQVGNLIDALAQAETEGAKADPAGNLTLRLADLRNTTARTRIDLGANAKGEALLRLLPAQRQQGDPTRLVEIAFDRYPGPDPSARLDALLSALFGSHDSASAVEHDEATLGASRRLAAPGG